MSDSIVFLNGEPHCRAGHIVQRFNTEDLDPLITVFYIHEGQMYCAVSEKYELNITGGRIYIAENRRLVPHMLTGMIEISGVCPECARSYSANYSILWSGDSLAAAPWLCLELRFEDGQLLGIKEIVSQTPEEIQDTPSSATWSALLEPVTAGES